MHCLRGLARGMVRCGFMESSPRGKHKKTENGKGRLGNVYQHT